MAKITTITNPLTGQPAQVDQLDHTAQQIDDAIARALPGGAIDSVLSSKPNPNLLDNWYFGNPIDQRQGRVVVPNTTYFSDNTLTTAAGTTSAYVTAYRYATGTANGVSYASFKLTDSDSAPTYYAAPENVVRGYTGAGYGIDRWVGNRDQTITIADNYLNIVTGNDIASGFSQFLPREAIPTGATVTLSFLFAPGTQKCQFGLRENNNWGYFAQAVVQTDETSCQLVSVTIPDVALSTGIFVVWLSFEVDNPGSVMRPIAVKLELGSQQTLAHQDADGNWVLNEIPDFGEQLARCQRYQLVLGSETYSAIGIGVGRTTNDVFTSIPTPVTMRTIPTATIQGVAVARCNGVYLNSTDTAEILHSPGVVNLAFNVSEVQSGAPYDVFLTPGSKLILDANL